MLFDVDRAEIRKQEQKILPKSGDADVTKKFADAVLTSALTQDELEHILLAPIPHSQLLHSIHEH